MKFSYVHIAPTLKAATQSVAHKFRLGLLTLLLLGSGAWGIAQAAESLFPKASSPSTVSLTQRDTAGATVQTPQVRAQLVAHAPQGVQPGQTFWLGLQLEHEPHWHTYWRNPGDSGLPTQLSWTLPAGLTAGDIIWPTPKKIAIGSLTNYGFEGSNLLVVPIQIARDFKVLESLDVILQAQWLVCRQECIPQDGRFSLRLATNSATASHAPLFESALRQQARPLAPQPGQTEARVSQQGQRLQLRVSGLPADWQGRNLNWFPITPEIVSNSGQEGRDWAQSWKGAVWTAELPVSPERSEHPAALEWLLTLDDSSSKPGVTVQTPVSGTWPASAPAAQVSPALAQALKNNAAMVASEVTAIIWLWALIGAFVGGLLLNLMPCVFPVLAIKVFALAQPGQTRTAHRWAGWAYTVGVVFSFVALGGLMLALRAAGQQLGWGFQLQSPMVVATLCLLFTLLGLNLAGLFEFGLFIPDRWASMQSRHPTVNALGSGVLAVAIASPCTAPFMGASLGLAIGLPAWQALPIFAAMGIGLALPYLAASWWPVLAEAMPRPGAWMQTLRQALAFPMFATVVWLLWVLGQQTGLDGAAALLGLLVMTAFLVWAWGLQGRARWIMSAVGLVMTWVIGQTLWPLLNAAPQNTTATIQEARWQVWSESEVQSALAAGHPVFVDFTAAWCVTCQFNKKTTLSDTEFLTTVQERQAVLLRADWTRRDPAITQALTQLGRSGVPVYVVYVPGLPAQVLSELPSVQDITDALRQSKP